MTNATTEDKAENRQYSRVDVYVPMEWKVIHPEHIDTCRSRVAGESILAEFKSLPNPDDQLIAQWLQSINAKLDEIIRMMTRHSDGFHCLSVAKVNIGGGGMRLNTGGSLTAGDILEIKVMIGLQKPVALFLYGEVLESGEAVSEYDTAVRFIHIDDFVRDEIIRFVFETEREILREKRR